MITVTKLVSAQLQSCGLDDEVIRLDKENMGPILALAGIPFPEEKRRKGFESEGTFHLAFDQREQLVGYLEYSPHWHDSKAIFISSLQIAPLYRNTRLFLHLLASAISDLKHKPFTRIESNVQKHNTGAIRIYQKLGFTVCEEKASQTSYPVYADWSLLDSELARRLMKQV